jgi:hypothetical protein
MWSSDYIIISLIKIIMDTDNTMPIEEEKKEGEMTPAEGAPEEMTPAETTEEGEATAM